MRIGLDLGGTKTEGVVLAADGTLVHRARRPTPAAAGYDAVLANLVTLALALERAAGRRCSIGLGTPGAVSSRTGRMKNANTVCLNDQPLADDLSRHLDRPVRLANDANCFALSEAVDGAAASVAVVFGIILGTGVGGGIVVDGRLLAGRDNIAGEWGHNVLDPSGPACYCGQRGCVETFLSGPGLVADYTAAGGLAPDVSTIVAHAAAGQSLATRTLQRYYARFGRAVATVVNILDPDIIVLGGGLSAIDALYLAGPRELARYVFNDRLDTPIVRNRHGPSSGVRGAAALWRVGEWP